MGGGNGARTHDSGFLRRASGLNLSALNSNVTNSSGGTDVQDIAAGVGVYSISFDANLAAGPPAGTSAGDMVTAFIPGHKFKLIALDFVTSIAGVGSSASQTYNLEIGTTNVTAGTCVVTEASTSAVGELTTGAAITGADEGSASDTISIEQAASGSAFTGGAGVFVVTLQNLDTADAFTSLANAGRLVTDESNARVLRVPEDRDTVGSFIWTVPRDYDEATDYFSVRVLASMVSVSTDDDVELDSEIYIKTAGTALGSDLDITAPGTVLSTTEQWIEFPVSAQGLDRDDLVQFKLITNGGNDTAGEEVQIHDIEVVYRSTLVSYHKETSAGVQLR